MPDSFLHWLDSLAAWQQVTFFCSLFMGFTALGIVVIHPALKRILHDEEPSNEAIIHIAGIVGLFYAVLLGLLTIATFENTKNLSDTIESETSSLSTLYRTVDGYSEPLRASIKADLRDYTRYVVTKDWPAHRRGESLKGGEHRLQVIRKEVLSFEPKSPTEVAVHNEMLRYLNTMTVAREQRMSSV
jgi:hypothetical protein